MGNAPASGANLTPSSMDRDAASFARHLRAANLSPRTIQCYLEATTLFRRHLAAQELPATTEAIRREHVEAFIADLLERYRPATAHNRNAGGA